MKYQKNNQKNNWQKSRVEFNRFYNITFKKAD